MGTVIGILILLPIVILVVGTIIRIVAAIVLLIWHSVVLVGSVAFLPVAAVMDLVNWWRRRKEPGPEDPAQTELPWTHRRDSREAYEDNVVTLVKNRKGTYVPKW